MALFNRRTFPPVGELVSRNAARASGQNIWFSGKSCVHGHRTWRYVKTNKCVDCERATGLKKYAARMTDGGLALRVKAQDWRRTNPAAYALANLKRRAKEAGFEFSLTRDDLLFPERCQCCNQVMEIGETPSGAPTRQSPSVDRIDSAKGYTPDNIAFICFRCNVLKRDGTVEEFEKIIAYMRRVASSKVVRLKAV